MPTANTKPVWAILAIMLAIFWSFAVIPGLLQTIQTQHCLLTLFGRTQTVQAAITQLDRQEQRLGQTSTYFVYDITIEGISEPFLFSFQGEDSRFEPSFYDMRRFFDLLSTVQHEEVIEVGWKSNRLLHGPNPIITRINDTGGIGDCQFWPILGQAVWLVWWAAVTGAVFWVFNRLLPFALKQEDVTEQGLQTYLIENIRESVNLGDPGQLPTKMPGLDENCSCFPGTPLQLMERENQREITINRCPGCPYFWLTVTQINGSGEATGTAVQFPISRAEYRQLSNTPAQERNFKDFTNRPARKIEGQLIREIGGDEARRLSRL
ncbi:MAG: hypothetical protein QNJ45_26470 [Ardenticatenaceae bacterium]|nr:hypothetical protein [Ardenticatenaceae bacterium]